MLQKNLQRVYANLECSDQAWPAVCWGEITQPPGINMRYFVVISANKLAWPPMCAACLGVPNTTVTIATRKITSRNLHEATWEIPYCSACKTGDETAPLKFGWFKSFLDTFTKKEYSVEYISLHLTAHKFAFRSKTYLEAFLEQNNKKGRSDVWEK